MFTIVASRTTISCAMPSRARIHHRRDSFDPVAAAFLLLFRFESITASSRPHQDGLDAKRSLALGNPKRAPGHSQLGAVDDRAAVDHEPVSSSFTSASTSTGIDLPAAVSWPPIVTLPPGVAPTILVTSGV